MKKDIPHIEFNPETSENLGFEIVPIKKIIDKKGGFNHDPESPHQIQFYNLIVFTKGKGRHFVDFNWYPVQQNSLVYLTKEQVNAFEFSEDLDGFCILFTEAYFVSCFAALPKNFVFRLFNPQLFSPIIQVPKTSDVLTYFNLLKEEYNRTEGFNHKTILESLFVILISKAEQIKQEQTFYIKDSKKMTLFHSFTSLIETNFAKTRSAEWYAKTLATTYKHLNTVCKALVNKTAKTVINDFIILQAKRNLINSTIKSTELAYKLGFEDPTNFTKYFKKHTGLTPNEFKNKSISN